MEKERKRISLATYVVSLIIMVAIIIVLAVMMVRDNASKEITEDTLENVSGEETVIEENEIELSNSELEEYKEITERLEGIDGLCVTEVIEKEDNTYTLRGEIYTEYTISETELNEIIKNGKMIIDSKECKISNIEEDEEGNKVYYLQADGEDYKYYIERLNNDMYHLQKPFEVTDMWKSTNEYAEITVSGDCKVIGQFWNEPTVKELFIERKLGENNIEPEGFLYNFNFENGKVVEVEHILTSL